jgi:hypothetical protein
MEPTSLELFKVRLMALTCTLDKTAQNQKGGSVTRPMADQFNMLLAEVGVAFPSIKDALPERLEATTKFADHFATVDATYLDLEVFVEQVLGVVERLGSER